MSDTELITRDYEMPEVEKIKSGLIKIREYQNIVKELLVKDLDYGVIPGTQKPTLLKPGAEKLAKIHGLADTYEIVKSVEDWDKPFFEYVIKCTLTHLNTGKTISEGIGSCNSLEGKYRYRNIYKKEDIPADVTFKEKKTRNGIIYLIPNDDIFSQVNTLQKMAKKRALVDATLSACRLSAIFTQDIEDLPAETLGTQETEKKDNDKKKLSEYHTKLLALLEKTYKDVDTMKEALKELTTWEKDGKVHEGKTSLYDISEPAAKVAYGKLKKSLEKEETNDSSGE